MAVCIWQPKYCTKEVLVATNKVKPGKNLVFFAGDKTYKDLYSYDGDKVRSDCKITSNGKIYCYCIPLSWLSNEGELPENLKEIQINEYNKFKSRMKKGKN